MTENVILVSTQPGESRIAVLEDGRLTDIIIKRSLSASIVGNIYLGRVEKVLTGMQAAFVDVGLGRSAFLGLADARLVPKQNNAPEDSISDYVKEGDAVLVQVSRDAFEDKGAKLSLRISLPGRFMVFAPGQGVVKISRRLGDADERKRLAAVLTGLSDESEGIIVRTAAEGSSDQDLAEDLGHLRSLWQSISERQKDGRAPLLLLDQAGSIVRMLGDLGSLTADRIIVDDTEVLAEINREAGAAAELHSGTEDLFGAHGVEEQVDAALFGTVTLPSGGTILIDEARALTAIDVNTGTGRFSSPEEMALRTNLEAVKVIAPEIRLRNLSGLLIIDVVPMRNNANKTKVLAQLRTAVKADLALVHVIGFTKLGLIEMTRERKHESLATIVCGGISGDREKSAFSLALDALRQSRREAHVHAGRALALTAAPSVINALKSSAGEALAATNARLGRPLILEADSTLADLSFHVRPFEDGKG